MPIGTISFFMCSFSLTQDELLPDESEKQPDSEVQSPPEENTAENVESLTADVNGLSLETEENPDDKPAEEPGLDLFVLFSNAIQSNVG